MRAAAAVGASWLDSETVRFRCLNCGHRFDAGVLDEN